MNYIKTLLTLSLLVLSITAFSQTETKSNVIATEWQTISLGKLQKKPRFKEPMISVRFYSEEGSNFMNLSLKYMFTDAVFEEAVPVEYYKNEKLDCNTDKGKYELKSVRYAKARRMSTVAQKTADIRVIFSGDLSFLSNSQVKNFTVHYAQGYQDIDLNPEEARNLQSAYNKFLAMLPQQQQPQAQQPSQAQQKPAPKPAEAQNVEIEGVAPKARPDSIKSSQNSLDRLRKQARGWGR